MYSTYVLYSTRRKTVWQCKKGKVVKYRAYLKKFKIEEVSIIFTDRVNGKSKMNSAIIREAVFGVIAMKFRSIFFKKNF